MRSKAKKIYCCISFIFALAVLTLTLTFGLLETPAYASPVAPSLNNNGLSSAQDGPQVDAMEDATNGLSIMYNNEEGTMSATIKIVLILTIISLAPSILIMMTSFTRIIVVLHFLRVALGTQTTPPNQVLIGLALFLTLMIMSPVFSEINENAIKPLDAGTITQEQAIEAALDPIRGFMYQHTERKDVDLFCDIAGVTYETNEDIPTSVLIPSFILSELRSAFIIGFFIYIPFIVIDMVVSSILMSMGMMMLPPTTISMPFKILLFVLADGWNLVIGNLVKTFY
ncbi:MAG: flagellar type III secretion system pore protein FliP [Eubacterium sp.]|nr:flagellar type III secretion system pore protein FliP [Eubacterium sp.]